MLNKLSNKQSYLHNGFLFYIFANWSGVIPIAVLKEESNIDMLLSCI